MEENTSKDEKLLPDGLLGKWIVERGGIWQQQFLDAAELADFAKKRTLPLEEKDIIVFWNLGLLKADFVASQEQLSAPGLLKVGEDNGVHLYADIARPLKNFNNESLKLTVLPPGVKLKFHMFRFFVLYNLVHSIKSIGPSFSFLYPLEPYISSILTEKQWFEKYYKSPDFQLCIEFWNDFAAFLIVTEPSTYRTIFGVSIYHYYSETEQETLAEKHLGELLAHYRTVDLEKLKGLHKNLCFITTRVEPNTDVHNILRFIKNDKKLKIEGALGAAIVFRTMAEMLRRATEKAYKVELLEEDIASTGTHVQEFRKEVFGSERIFDGYRKVALTYLRRQGLDYNIRLKWYVEGTTELGALNNFFGKNILSGVEIVNLKGNVVAKNEVAFRDNLREDQKNQIFSFVSIDGDVSPNLRVVKNAAKQDEIFGAFFISKPDFEFANFTPEELATIAGKIALDGGIDEKELESLAQNIMVAKKNNQSFDKKLSGTQKLYIKKDERWGASLMDYAWEHEQKPDGTKRPIIEALEKALRVINPSSLIDYNYNRQHYQVNAETGELIPRKIEPEQNSL